MTVTSTAVSVKQRSGVCVSVCLSVCLSVCPVHGLTAQLRSIGCALRKVMAAYRRVDDL